MTQEQKIRRYINIGDEVRFLNSNKKYVFIRFLFGDKPIKIRLSDKPIKNDNIIEHMYTREEFNKVLKTEWYKDKE
jgi:hypothetical protein